MSQHDEATTPAKREQTRTVAAAVLGGILVLFAVLNLDQVKINWIVASWRTPLIVALAVSMALGAAIGWLAARRRER